MRKIICLLLANWSFITIAQDNTDIILQYQSSHPLNSDRATLIFGPNRVELATNFTFFSLANPRLGLFQRPYNGQLVAIKRKILAYQKLIFGQKQRNGGSQELMAKIRKKFGHDFLGNRSNPSSIKIKFKGQMLEVRESNPHFNALKDALTQARGPSWNCEDCAEYKRVGTDVSRVVKKNGHTVNTTIFSRQQLHCRTLPVVGHSKERIECFDAAFGLFEI